MTDVIKLLTTFIDSVAFLMALVLTLSLIHRGGRDKLINKAIMGGIFSVAIILTMSDPITLPKSSGIFDMRSLLVGTAAGLLGPVVGFVAFATAAVYRTIIAGPGLTAGLVGIAVSFGAGLFWYYAIREREAAAWKKSIMLGGLLSLQVFAIFFTPQALWGTLFSNLAPYMVVSSVFGALIINHLLSGELSFLSEAKASKIDANTDHLTGLLNRRGLDLVYPEMMKGNRKSKGQAVLYFDIDRFKVTNDSYGHAVGDEVLRHVVNHVAASLRQKDTFVRLGGDEFVVILPDIDAEEAHSIGERCRAIVAESGFEMDCKVLPLTISVGAVWSRQPAGIDRMLQFADKALYRAKNLGRNAVVFSSDENAEALLAS